MCPSERGEAQLVLSSNLFLGPQAQALLRWHQTSRFCAATGQPTRRNQAGSQRVSGSGSVYYPQVGVLPATAEDVS